MTQIYKIVHQTQILTLDLTRQSDFSSMEIGMSIPKDQRFDPNLRIGVMDLTMVTQTPLMRPWESQMPSSHNL